MTDTATPAWATLPALMYHSVSAIGGPLGDLAVPPSRLTEHFTALTAAGYRLVGLAEALDLLAAGADLATGADNAAGPGKAAGSTDKLVAVTFDDGYRNFLTAGLPVLAATGARATLYASVGHLGDRAGWLGRWAPDFGRLLTWDELAEVADAGVEIGNHSLVHHPLDVLPPDQLRNEIVRSHGELEQRLGRKVRGFAYPHGYNGRRVRDVVRETGYDHATEVGRRLHRPGDNRFAVPRLQPTPAHTGEDLVALVSGGGSQLVPQMKRLAQPAWRVARKVALRSGRTLT
ncbi:polysaccharide deacetylase family protein [Actinoplanes sp. NPDC049265]|uniref:polysaccharide deacetylase family protein n=1 Tax=Actinoplanes sp. NPDC049265 TaxID=3363902 RepID=UPI00371D452B